MGTFARFSKLPLYFRTTSHKICFLVVLCLIALVQVEAQKIEEITHAVTINPQQVEDSTGKLTPHVFEIKTDSADLYIPGNGVQVLEDNTGKLTFDQVTHEPLVGSFHLNNVRKYNFSAYAFWFRFGLKNIMDHDEDICFTSTAEYTDYYIRRSDGTWKHLQTGMFVPGSKIDGIKNLRYVTLNIKAGEELLIYRRDRNNSAYIVASDFDTFVSFKDKVIENAYVIQRDDYLQDTAWVLLAGILILSAFFNFFFFGTTKDKVYLYFAQFVFFYSII